MKIYYDEKVDAAYLRLSEEPPTGVVEVSRVINEPAGFTDPGCLSRVFTLAGLKGSVRKTLSLCVLCKRQ